MSKRLMVVVGATAVAGLVLGASIVFGPEALTGGGPSVPDIDAPGARGTPTGDPDQLNASIREFNYFTVLGTDADGEVQGLRLRAKRSNLKPMGVTELIEPRADIRLGPQRAITIAADKADMKMEDKKPRAGQFTGNVVVTLFEAPAGTDLITDPANPEHLKFVQQRIYLDAPTNFDIESNLIDTPGPVHVTSAQVDFYGIGLLLTYNTQRERIEQLVVSEGRYGFFNPEADAAGFEKDKPKKDPQAQADAPADREKPEPAVASQYYRAEFVDDVVVRDGIESEMGGRLLTIDFSLGTEAVTPKPVVPETSSGLPAVLMRPGVQLVQVDTPLEGDADAVAAPALPIIAIPEINAQRSLFNHDPERDVVITWTGKLAVSPQPRKPEALADDKDVLITLVGENTYAQTTRNGEVERLETVELEYLLSQERTTAKAGQDKPVHILSEKLGGEITGTKLVVRQQDALASILGPGKLTWTDPDTQKQLTLGFQNRLDLQLYIKQRDPAEPDADQAQDKDNNTLRQTATRVFGVKTATFDGEVSVLYPDFKLDARTLTIAFAKPDKEAGIKNKPTSITAQGDIAIHARGAKEDEVFDIAAQDRITIDLDQDEQTGDTYASGIHALDRVVIHRQHPRTVFRCDRVDVDLTPPSQNGDNARPQQDDNAEPGENLRFAKVSMIHARGNVSAQLNDKGRRVDLVADLLIGDVERDRLTLFANVERKPAEIIIFDKQLDPNAELLEADQRTISHKLTGKLVVMDDKAQALNIDGAGSLATRIGDPKNPGAPIEDAYLTVAWTKSMAFNNITGEAEFHENVRSESRRSTDASELTCDHLFMLISPDYEHDPRRLVEDDGKDAHQRQVRYATAAGNVKFMAAAWEPATPERITNRLTLAGPRLVFTNRPASAIGDQPTETLVVDGAGSMQIEDYRPPRKTPDQDDKPDRLTMTGRGMSLFKWQESMTLNTLSNTATLLGTVEMTHLPKDAAGKEGQAVLLDSQQLVADLVDTGGLSVWLSDASPEARVAVIAADDKVKLTIDRLTITADHMKFSAEKDKVELWSDQKMGVLIQDPEKDEDTRADKIIYDLINKRYEAVDVQGGATPGN